MVVVKLIDVPAKIESKELLNWGRQLGLNNGDNVVEHINKLNNDIKGGELVLCEPKDANVYWTEYPDLTPPMSKLYGLTVYERPYPPLPEEADKLLEHPDKPELGAAADWARTVKGATDKGFEEAAMEAMEAPAAQLFPDELRSVVNQKRARAHASRTRARDAADKRAAKRYEAIKAKKKVAERALRASGTLRMGAEAAMENALLHGVVGGGRSYRKSTKRKRRTKKRRLSKKRKITKRRLSKKRKITKRKIYKR
jgi:hypothetical protein